VGKTIYVDENATGSNDSSSWVDAYNFLQDALADANSAEKPIEIWVAQGTYTPDSNSAVPDGTVRQTATFQLINGVSVYGGFPSGGAEFGQRDPNLYETFLSGDLLGNDVHVSDPFDLLNEPTRAENSYHVVTGSRIDETAVLDGFAITAGNANGDYPDHFGGGVYNWYRSSPTLANCTFSGNSAYWSGGGMDNDIVSNPTLINCTFSGNSAHRGGGMSNTIYSSPTLTNCTFSGNSAGIGSGIHNYSSSSPTLTSCTFSGNSAWDGGGMYNYESSPNLSHCTFSGNSAKEDGGGMFSYWDSSPNLTNCTFSDNSAENGGGMDNYYYSSPILTNCSFSGNSAENDGGGMYNNVWSSPTPTNCTFSGNSAENGGGMYNNVWSSPTLTNCNFIGNSAEDDGGGMYSYLSSPTLANCTFSGNSAGIGGGMYNNNFYSSPTLTNCTFAQNSAQNGNALACDYNERSGPSNVVMTNCILWDGDDEIWNNDNSTILITFSNVHGGFPGEGNIDIDPCFVNPSYWDPNGTPDDPNDDFWVDGDYHLKSEAGRWDPNGESWIQDNVSSPCIDAGDSDTCIGFEPNPNGDVINMGAYGGTAEASLSPSDINCISDDHPDYEQWVPVGKPVCWCYHRQCHGDTDCKFQSKDKYWVSTSDLDILIAAWNKPFYQIEGQTVNSVPLICADFDHKAQGKSKYRVSTDDLDILITNWRTKPISRTPTVRNSNSNSCYKTSYNKNGEANRCPTILSVCYGLITKNVQKTEFSLRAS
jgi:parallel beta-helix repeat protein